MIGDVVWVKPHQRCISKFATGKKVTEIVSPSWLMTHRRTDSSASDSKLEIDLRLMKMKPLPNREAPDKNDHSCLLVL